MARVHERRQHVVRQAHGHQTGDGHVVRQSGNIVERSQLRLNV